MPKSKHAAIAATSSNQPTRRLLVPRKEAREELLGGISQRKIKNLEEEGLLIPKRLGRSPNAQVLTR